MDDDETSPNGALYRFDGRRLHRCDDDYVITNRPATSPDGRTLYHIDTLQRVIYAFALAGTTMTPPLVITMIAFFCWGMASHAFGAVQDIVPDREGGIGSIATAFGAAATVRLAASLWLIAGVLMLFTPWPANLAALAAVPYIVVVAPFLNVDDAHSATANRAWRGFLAINYAVGFAITMLLIACAGQGLFD